MTKEEKQTLAKVAYFFNHTMGRMNVAQSALTGYDIGNWNEAALEVDALCRSNGITIEEDQK